MMNVAQKKAATAPIDTPLIILAGPGSGKTTTLVHRCLNIRDQLPSSSSRCLVLTFSTNAAEETRHRFSSLLGNPSTTAVDAVDASFCEITTFHSFAFKLVRRYWSKLGFVSPPLVCTHREAIKELIAVAKESSCLGHLIREEKSKESRLALKSFLSLLTSAKAFPSPLTYLERNCKSMAKHDVVRTFNAFQSRLRGSGLLQFSDMIPLALQLLEENTDVLDEVRRWYSAVLADEFQDTNSVQLKLLLLLASHGRVTVVGDIDQLIFAFQGADSRNFAEFESYYQKRNTSINVVNLVVNYRSSASIISGCNALINEGRSVTSVPPLRQSSASSSSSSSSLLSSSAAAAASDDLPLFHSIVGACGTKNMVADGDARLVYRAVRIVECPNEFAEFDFVCSQIKALLASNSMLSASDRGVAR